MKPQLSDKALVHDLYFRILAGEFGNIQARRKNLGEEYEEAQRFVNAELVERGKAFEKFEKRIDELELQIFMFRALLFKLGRNPDAEIDWLTDEDLARYRAFTYDMEKEYL